MDLLLVVGAKISYFCEHPVFTKLGSTDINTIQKESAKWHDTLFTTLFSYVQFFRGMHFRLAGFICDGPSL